MANNGSRVLKNADVQRGAHIHSLHYYNKVIIKIIVLIQWPSIIQYFLIVQFSCCASTTCTSG